MGIAGLVVGALLEGIVSLVLDTYTWLDGGSYLNDSQRFWMARPITVNVICCGYVVIAFSGIWWRGLWRSAIFARIWIGGMCMFATIYTGLYGWFFFAQGKSAAPWQFFLAFGTLPVATTLTIMTAYKLTGNKRTDVPVGWPVSAWFWWLLPLGLAGSFALIALLGFGPLAQCDGATDRQLNALIVVHGINGVVLGLTLRLTTWTFRLIPDVQRPVVGNAARQRC